MNSWRQFERKKRKLFSFLGDTISCYSLTEPEDEGGNADDDNFEDDDDEDMETEMT